MQTQTRSTDDGAGASTRQIMDAGQPLCLLLCCLPAGSSLVQSSRRAGLSACPPSRKTVRVAYAVEHQRGAWYGVVNRWKHTAQRGVEDCLAQVPYLETPSGPTPASPLYSGWQGTLKI